MKPSAASVATRPSRLAQTNLPSNVQRFEQLMYLSLGVSLVDVPLEWDRFVADSQGNASVAAFGIIFSFAILVLLIWQAARNRRNWARWALLAIFVLSTIPELQHFKGGPLAGFCSLASYLTAAAGLFFVFTGEARSWYEASLTCSKCGAVQYTGGSVFCTRCGTSLKLRYYNAPRANSGWKSIPFIVRLAIYSVSGMVLLSVGFWLLMVLAVFGSHPHP